MDYRKLPSGEKVSTLGFGAGNLRQADDSEIYKMFTYGIESGMNFMDTVSVEETFTKPVKEAIKDCREDLYIQMHLGGVYINGKYKKSREIDCIDKSFHRDLKKYGTDYCDFGLLHAVDEVADYEYIMKNGCFEHAIKLRNEGLINHIGISSHNPEVCSKFIETQEVDLFMMSINPSFDYIYKDNKLVQDEFRREFYKECKKNKIAISVMKAFGGGKLLDKNISPLNIELSQHECIDYALSIPSVVTVLPGITSFEELKQDLDYYEKTIDKNYLKDITNINKEDSCIYCKHCMPCTNNLDIALIHKLYDLSIVGDEIATEHYYNLTKHASDCVACGLCMNNCPFNLDIIKDLKEIKKYYGK